LGEDGVVFLELWFCPKETGKTRMKKDKTTLRVRATKWRIQASQNSGFSNWGTFGNVASLSLRDSGFAMRKRLVWQRLAAWDTPVLVVYVLQEGMAGHETGLGDLPDFNVANKDLTA
jgi:hypothetical protein